MHLNTFYFIRHANDIGQSTNSKYTKWFMKHATKHYLLNAVRRFIYSFHQFILRTLDKKQNAINAYICAFCLLCIQVVKYVARLWCVFFFLVMFDKITEKKFVCFVFVQIIEYEQKYKMVVKFSFVWRAIVQTWWLATKLSENPFFTLICINKCNDVCMLLFFCIELVGVIVYLFIRLKHSICIRST